MEVQGERKDEDRGPSYEGGYLYSDKIGRAHV